MRKMLTLLGAAAVTFAVAPAGAKEFTGARAGVAIGYANDAHEEAFTYGANIGYDIKAGAVLLGGTLDVTDSTKTGLDLSATVRLGVPLSRVVMPYVLIGYTNLDAHGHHDGARAGAGVEIELGGHVYSAIEYLHSNYEDDLKVNAGTFGLGLRF